MPLARNPEAAADLRERHAGVDDGSASVLELLSVLLRYRWSIVLLPLIAFAVTVGLSLQRDRTYTSTAAFVPQAAEPSSAGLAGVAAQFGIALPATRAAESPAFYADLLQSREILGAAVLTNYDSAAGTHHGSGNLVERFSVAERRSPAVRHDAAVRALREAMQVNVSRETGVLRLSVRTESPRLSMAIVERLLELVNEFNLHRRQSQAGAERRFGEERVRAAQGELLAAEDRLQRFLQRNRQFRNSPELQFEHDRLERDVMMRQQVYTALAQAYEQARIEEVRNIPVITVIERPAAASTPDPRGTVVKGLLALLLGGMLAVLLAFARDFVRRGRRDDNAHGEFDRLRAEAIADLRHPLDRFRRALARR